MPRRCRNGQAQDRERSDRPYAGDIASVDHIIPRSIVEELDEKYFNLEFMPSKLNQRKGNDVTLRQIQLAGIWHKQGLLSAEGLKDVMGGSKSIERPGD